MNDLIYDRTESDVMHAEDIVTRLTEGTATETERTEWLSGTLRGAMNADDFNRIEQWTAYLAAQLRGYGYAVVITPRAANTVTLTNLIPNPSFETDGSWSAVVYDAAQAKYGTRSSKLPAGATTATTCPMPTPTIGHTYYGRREILTDGDNQPVDCRFEWYAGDGAGLNWVFAWNQGNHPTWDAESAIHTIDAINTTSAFMIRNFVVSGTANVWTDGLLLVDLTAGFGAGKEPDKTWCDANIPFAEGAISIPITEWTREDYPHRTEIDRIRRNVDALQAGFYSLPDWREIVFNNTLHYEQANALEWDLHALYVWLERMVSSFVYAGEIYGGESDFCMIDVKDLVVENPNARIIIRANGTREAVDIARAFEIPEGVTPWNRQTARLLQADIRSYPVRAGHSINALDVVDIENGEVFKNVLDVTNISTTAIALQSGDAGETIEVVYSGVVQADVTAGDRIESDGVRAFAPVDGWLDVTGEYAREVFAGSYIGTGYQNVIDVGKKVKLLIVKHLGGNTDNLIATPIGSTLSWRGSSVTTPGGAITFTDTGVIIDGGTFGTLNESYDYIAFAGA